MALVTAGVAAFRFSSYKQPRIVLSRPGILNSAMVYNPYIICLFTSNDKIGCVVGDFIFSCIHLRRAKHIKGKFAISGGKSASELRGLQFVSIFHPADITISPALRWVA